MFTLVPRVMACSMTLAVASASAAHSSATTFSPPGGGCCSMATMRRYRASLMCSEAASRSAVKGTFFSCAYSLDSRTAARTRAGLSPSSSSATGRLFCPAASSAPLLPCIRKSSPTTSMFLSPPAVCTPAAIPPGKLKL